MLEIIKSYLTLEMSARDFAAAVQSNDELIRFINPKLPQTRDKNDEAWKNCPLNVNAFVYDDFDLRRTLTTGYYALTSISRCSTAYTMLWNLFHDDLPDVEKSTFYDELFLFALNTVPEYLDSVDVGSVIQDIILSTSDITPKTKRQKAVRAALKVAFHLDSSAKRPYWIQSSEWPLGVEDKPMRYLGQSKKGEYAEYYFEDVTSGEQHTVTQFY